MSGSKSATPARAISRKSSAVWLELRQRSSVARFSFPQDCDRGRRIAREGLVRVRQCACMKTNSIRTRSLKAIAGTALAVTMSADVTRAADQLAWDRTFPQSDKVIH